MFFPLFVVVQRLILDRLFQQGPVQLAPFPCGGRHELQNVEGKAGIALAGSGQGLQNAFFRLKVHPSQPLVSVLQGALKHAVQRLVGDPFQAVDPGSGQQGGVDFK